MEQTVIVCFLPPPELRSDGEKKSQIESLKLEIGALKEQIGRQQQELQVKAAQVEKPESAQMKYFVTCDEDDEV